MIQDTFKNRWIECLTTRGIINTKKLKNNQAKTYQCPNILIRFQIQYSKTFNFETESILVRGFEIQKLRSPKKYNFSLMNHGIESVSICEHLSVHHYVLYTVLIIKYRKENVSTKNLVGNLSFHHIFPCTIIISSPKTSSIECSGRTVMVVLHLFIHIWVNLIATPL